MALVSRRSLGGLAAAVGASIATTRRSVAGAADPIGITPRSAWGADLPPTGQLQVEADGDLRFLLVHHTAGSNDYRPDQVPDQLRTIHRLHTGPDRGWPDVAYNFFVDRHGGIWEGRQGSIDAPVMGSATGGSQGHAMLCCFLGTHTDTEPTAAATDSMVALLAWLAARYAIDTTPGATTQFVSRGSNRHPAGSTVTTPTIAGHRDMSSTACPGDAAYRLVTDVFPARVSALVAAAAVQSTTTSTPTTTTTAPTTTTPVRPDDAGDDASTTVLAAGGLAAAVIGAIGVVLARRRTGRQDPPG